MKYLKILVILSEWNERLNGLQGVSRSKKIHLQRRQDIVILSLLQKKQPNLSYWAVGEKSIDFKTHFKFMDTSLSLSMTKLKTFSFI